MDNVTIDGEFLNYYANFQQNFNIDPYEVSIKFRELPDDTIAQCISFGNVWGSIEVDPIAWKVLPEAHRHNLVYHELLHCTLFVGHDTDKYPDGCAKSIMYPKNFGEPCWSMHYQYYINQYRK